mmetsp:Transcript_47115/g.55048  ORF Transcript_47115/g.55048 Transcript_47115/m.55048 type:complete len:96 (-) Transcript_47115:369-656(-)
MFCSSHQTTLTAPTMYQKFSGCATKNDYKILIVVDVEPVPFNLSTQVSTMVRSFQTTRRVRRTEKKFEGPRHVVQRFKCVCLLLLLLLLESSFCM